MSQLLSLRLSHPEALHCTQGCLHTVYRLGLSPPQSLRGTHILAHTSLTIHRQDQGNPLTYRQCCELQAKSYFFKLWTPLELTCGSNTSEVIEQSFVFFYVCSFCSTPCWHVGNKLLHMTHSPIWYYYNSCLLI